MRTLRIGSPDGLRLRSQQRQHFNDQQIMFDRLAGDSAAIISQRVVSAYKYIDFPAVNMGRLPV